MALNVQNFRSQLKGDGARPTLFRVKVSAPAWVGFPSEKMTFMATATRLPSATLGTNLVPFMGQDVASLLAEKAQSRRDHPFLVWEPLEDSGAPAARAQSLSYGEFLKFYRGT